MTDIWIISLPIVFCWTSVCLYFCSESSWACRTKHLCSGQHVCFYSGLFTHHVFHCFLSDQKHLAAARVYVSASCSWCSASCKFVCKIAVLGNSVLGQFTHSAELLHCNAHIYTDDQIRLHRDMWERSCNVSWISMCNAYIWLMFAAVISL